jgi:predicted RNA-binding protein with PIN domain
VADHLIIVDGYNVILRSALLKPGPDRTLREAREKLVNLLSWALGSGDAQFIVVFDGAEQPGHDEREGRVEVRYSRPPRTADDVIRELVEDRLPRVERLTVVTSDLAVARHARAMGAAVALADLFLASTIGAAAGEKSETPEKPTTLSKREIEEWAELFRRGGTGAREDDDTV